MSTQGDKRLSACEPIALWFRYRNYLSLPKP